MEETEITPIWFICTGDHVLLDDTLDKSVDQEN